MCNARLTGFEANAVDRNDNLLYLCKDCLRDELKQSHDHDFVESIVESILYP